MIDDTPAGVRARRVLHAVDRLLAPTESFIAQRLRGDAYEASVVTWNRIENGLPVACPSICLPLDEEPPGERRWTRLPGELGRRLQAKLDLLHILRTRAPDVVHAHYGLTALRVVPACQLFGIPLVVSFYGFDASSALSDPGIRRGYRQLFSTDALLTAEGPALARRLVSIGARRENVRLLPLSLPRWALGPPARESPFDSPVLCLLQVARFVEKKGIDTTLRAVAGALGQGARVRLSLVGDGPLLAEVEEAIKELRLERDVSLTGSVRPEELPVLFSRAHALIQPSRTARNGDTEGGAPAVVSEAQAQGLPVLATNHADLPTIVKHGKTGLLSDEGDEPGLTHNLLRLARDRDLARALGEAARSRALRRHDPETLLKLQERLYARSQWRKPARVTPGVLAFGRLAFRYAWDTLLTPPPADEPSRQS